MLKFHGNTNHLMIARGDLFHREEFQNRLLSIDDFIHLQTHLYSHPKNQCGTSCIHLAAQILLIQSI